MPNSDPAYSSAAALQTERLFAATPAQIFHAIQKPELLARWWGPAGFTNTFQVFEFQLGGRWKFIMHSPTGTDYPNECVFREIEPGVRVVIEHVAEPWFRLTIALTVSDQQTLLQWTQQFANAGMAEKLRPICEPANEQNLDRLTAVVRETEGVQS